MMICSTCTDNTCTIVKKITYEQKQLQCLYEQKLNHYTKFLVKKNTHNLLPVFISTLNKTDEWSVAAFSRPKRNTADRHLI